MTAYRYILLSLVALSLVSACAGKPAQTTVAQPPPVEEYRLGIGDVITIRVYGGDEDLRFDRVRLHDRGKLTFPFGDFTPFGHTTREFETIMTDSLKGQFLLKPRVWVTIDEYRPYFMQGQVPRTGPFPYQPGLDVRKAITIAGGFGPRASKNQIFLRREHDRSEKPVKVDQNTVVRPGDTIIVEESFF